MPPKKRKRKVGGSGKQPTTTIIVDESDPDESDPVPVVWVRIEPDELYECSKKNILGPHGWLYGTEIHAGQALLYCRFPLVGGLQDPIFSGELVTPATTEFVQIVNSGAHWVCLSTIGCVLGEVKLFDSLYDRVNSIIRLHACRMLMHAGKSLTISSQKCQIQNNSSDCGLFALAFVTSICFGEDPSNISYDQPKLRQHFVHCLEKGEITLFPKSVLPVKRKTRATKTRVELFCSCRLPNTGDQYVQCSECLEWYHPDCTNIPDAVVNSREIWGCSKCLSYIN